MTAHYCCAANNNGLFQLEDSRQICGMAYCNSCATAYGYEHMSCCPHCHENSTIRLRRSPRHQEKKCQSMTATPVALFTDRSEETSPFATFQSSKTSSNGHETVDCGLTGLKSPMTKHDLIKSSLKNQTLFDDPKIFFHQIQDEGETLIAGRTRARNGFWRPKNSSKEYKVIRECAVNFLKRLRNNQDIFGNMPKLPKNGNEAATTINTVCNWLMKRNTFSKKRGEMTLHQDPVYWDYVKDEMNVEKKVYLMNQNEIIILACGAWGSTVEKAKKELTKDDQIRFVGIILGSEFLDIGKLDVIQRNKVSRDVIDDPAMTKIACFEDAAVMFSNHHVVIPNPPNWDVATSKHGGNDLDANNQLRMDLSWTGSDMEAIYCIVKTKYTLAMRRWTEGTGGGSGAPEDYGDWVSRDATEYFNGYATPVGGGMELTWMYMHDKDKGFPLFKSFEGLPESASVEDGELLANHPEKSTVSTKLTRDESLLAVSIDNISKITSSLEGTLTSLVGTTTDNGRMISNIQEARIRSYTDVMNEIQLIDNAKEKVKLKLAKKRDNSTLITEYKVLKRARLNLIDELALVTEAKTKSIDDVSMSSIDDD